MEFGISQNFQNSSDVIHGTIWNIFWILCFNHLHKGLLLLSIYHFNPLNTGFFFCYILYPYLSATLWKTGEGIFMNFLEDVCNKGHITVLVNMEGQLGLQCCFSDIKNASLISKINFWYQKFLNFWYQKIIFWYKKATIFSVYMISIKSPFTQGCDHCATFERPENG